MGKEMKTVSSVKSGLWRTKTAKTKYLTYVEHTMYSKLKCNMKLQARKKEKGV